MRERKRKGVRQVAMKGKESKMAPVCTEDSTLDMIDVYSKQFFYEWNFVVTCGCYPRK